MKRFDSEVAVVLMSDLMLLPPLDGEQFREWALTHQTLHELWDNCDRSDWLKWVADVAAAMGVIKPVQVPDGISAAEVRLQLGNPFNALNQGAIERRREEVSFWANDTIQVVPSKNCVAA